MTDGNKGGSAADIIRKYGVRANKKYGQNFLADGNVLREIVAAADISEKDIVLEIGPGTGALTGLLCESAAHVVAVEIDKKLIPVLEETLDNYDNLTILNADILKTDIRTLINEKGEGKRAKVVANLPYYITTPIIMELLEARLPIESMTIMIQKEVAERMTSPPGKKSYGALTLAVQYYTDARVIMEVPPSCFIPRPQVSSAVMRLDVRDEPPVKVQDEELLFDIIRASFNQRRKTLLNGLKNSPKLKYRGEDIAAAIEKLGKPASVRGEQLSLAEFARLSDLLLEYS